MYENLIIFCFVAGFTGGGCFMLCSSAVVWTARKLKLRKERLRWQRQQERLKQHRGSKT
jgi:hypothetical protein